MEPVSRGVAGGEKPHGGSTREADAPLGPQPLVRHAEGGQLILQAGGLELIRQARAPVHVVFAIGGSRCGKSTASNALIFGNVAADPEPPGCGSAAPRFKTGDSFEPVTEGVDVAVRPLQDGGTLVVADCEGAFHICGSSGSARAFGSLGLLAYNVSSVVLHVSMGNIDERDIEVLGFLAASADQAHGGASGAGSGAASNKSSPSRGAGAEAGPTLEPVARAPSLVLLVNGARFDLGDAVAKRLLQPPEGAAGGTEGVGRWSARAAIAHGFRGQPALEALPNCEHSAYWPKVGALRSRLLETLPMSLQPGGPQAAGDEIANRLEMLVSVLNGETPSVAALREPEPATEMLYRCAHLEPLVEDICRKFAAAGHALEMPSMMTSPSSSPAKLGSRSGKPVSPSKAAIEDALGEFDRRSRKGSQREGDASGADAALAPLREGLIADMRARLATRLQGINEALALGRKQGAQARPRRQASNPGGRRGSPESGGESDASSPKDAERTERRERCLHILDSSIEEFEEQLANCNSTGERELSDLRAVFAKHQGNLASMAQRTAEAEAQRTAETRRLHDRFHERLQQTVSERSRSSQTQTSHWTNAISKVQSELQGLSKLMTEPKRLAAQLAEVNKGLEDGRSHRQEMSNTAAQALDGRIRRLREGLDREGSALTALRDAVARRLDAVREEALVELEEERSIRRDRYTAMSEVVERLKKQLESSLEGHAEVRQAGGKFQPASRTG